jgi:hypothetical protein
VRKEVAPLEKRKGPGACVNRMPRSEQDLLFDGLTRGSGRNLAVAHHGPTLLTVCQYCMGKSHTDRLLSRGHGERSSEEGRTCLLFCKGWESECCLVPLSAIFRYRK